MPASPSNPLLFYTTTTTTLRTTTSATIGAILHLTIPTPLTPIATSYTTPPIPGSPASKAYPYGLPILVLTELDAVVYDPLGKEVVSTVTTVQAAPGGATGAVDDGGKVDRDAYLRNAWSDWTEAERAGVIAGIVVAVVITMGMLLWCCCRSRAWGRRGERKRRKRRMRERRWWKGESKKSGRGEREVESSKSLELESDPGGKAVRNEVGARSLGRAEGLPKISVSRKIPDTVREDRNGAPDDRDREPTGEPYQMSGALQIPRSPAPMLLRAPTSAVRIGVEEVRERPLGTEASLGRTSTYRAMRAQERRDERARAYTQLPV